MMKFANKNTHKMSGCGLATLGSVLATLSIAVSASTMQPSIDQHMHGSPHTSAPEGHAGHVMNPDSGHDMQHDSSHDTGHEMKHEMDHDMHRDSGHGMDEHAQHRKMMEHTGYQRTVTHYAPPAVTLVGMDGQQTSLEQVLDTDRPLLVNFIFTSCTTICPIMSATFSQAQVQLGSGADPIDWVSITIDPEHDTPERLREYAKKYGAGPNWRFFTGESQQIAAVQKAFDVYNGSKMNHKPVTLMRHGRNEPWVRLDGLTSGKELVNEYQQLAKH